MPSSSREETDLHYALCIGINSYASSADLHSLQYAEADAQAMYEVLLQRGFASEHCCLLLGAEATTDAINEALEDLLLNKAKTNDLVLFYFAGHGVLLPKPGDDNDETVSDVFLASHDFDRQRLAHKRGVWLNYPTRFGRFKQDFFERTRSKKVLFIIDSCHSGDFFGTKYRDDMSMQHLLHQSFGKMSEGRIVLSSCLPQQKAREDKNLGHGLFTYHLLQALRGQARAAVRPGGVMTVSSLFDYLDDIMPETQSPVESGVKHGSFKLLYFPQWDETDQNSVPSFTEASNQNAAKKLRLQKLLANHQDFLQSRLDSFVGRVRELAEVQQKIEQKMVTGGYVTITGQAGQGKSSIIAKLIELYGPETVTFHFIPFNPGPDHQVGLLRNIMARLIIKYDLPEFYVVGERRTTFRDFFPHVLEDIAAKGGHEIIFIDGLDQIEMDGNGLRDLSFLPEHIPAGIVCVLGTRPNDTLKPLKLLQPHDEYPLRNLSLADFDLILQHRQISLGHALVNQFYVVMQENALYLDLVAKVLHDQGTILPEELITSLAHDPNHIFSLTIDRLKQPAIEWHEVLKPILGVLLAACEPLSDQQIRHILNIDHDRISHALTRLGGLLNVSSDYRYSFFHLQFQHYLRQDEHLSDKEYLFAIDEEKAWHKKLLKWLENENIDLIWQDVQYDEAEQSRRKYAQQHYITHLYYAGEWQKLFDILNAGVYGQGKVRFGSGTHSYAQDLYLGLRAAMWAGRPVKEAVALLPHMWRYALLRSSLKSRADHYSLAMFEVLMLRKREAEALGLVELLTNQVRKVEVLVHIAHQIEKEAGRKRESIQLLMSAYETAKLLKETHEGLDLLRQLSVELITILVQAHLWDQAESIARDLEEPGQRAEALRELGTALTQAQRLEQASGIWAEAEAIARTLEEPEQRAKALKKLFDALLQAQLWDQAEAIARTLEEPIEQTEALRELGTALTRAQRLEQASGIWAEAEAIARTLKEPMQQAEALRELFDALLQAQLWDQAESIVHALGDLWKQVSMFQESSKALMLSGQDDSIAFEKLKPYMKAGEILFDALLKAQLWDKVESFVHALEKPWSRADVMRELGTALTQAQRLEQASGIWTEAEAIARTLKEPMQQAEALRELGTALTQAQRWDQAEVLAHALEEPWHRARALRGLFDALLQAQLWDQAEAIARDLEEPWQRAEALRELGTALTRAQRLEQASGIWAEAEAIARTLEEPMQQTWALGGLVDALLQAQLWDQAEAIARDLEEPWHRAEALGNLGTALTQAQRLEQASGIWTEAEAIARTLEEPWQRTRALRRLFDALLQAQLWDQAEALARTLAEPGQRTEVLRELCKALIQAELWDKAEAIALEKPKQRVEVLGELIVGLMQERLWDQAESFALEEMKQRMSALEEPSKALVPMLLWEQAGSIALEETKQRMEVLEELSKALIQAELWERAESVTRSLEASWYKTTTLQKIMVMLAQAQVWKRVDAICKEFETIAPSVEELKQRIKVLGELGKSLMQIRQQEQAETVWAEAEALVHSIHEAQPQAEAFAQLSKAFAQAQQWERAESIAYSLKEILPQADALTELNRVFIEAKQWERARTAASSIQEPQQKAKALTELGEALVFAQQWDQVESIIESVDKLWIDREERSTALGKALIKTRQWKRAETLMPSIRKAEALLEIGIELIKAQQYERSDEVWTRVERQANSLKEWDQRAQVLAKLIQALAQVQLWEKAEEVIGSIDEWVYKAEAQRNLSQFLAQEQLYERAEKLARTIDIPEERARALMELGKSLALHQQGGWSEAMWEANKVTFFIWGDWERARTLCILSTTLAHIQQWKWAEETAQSIHISRWRAEALGELGKVLALHQHWQWAKMVWSAAETAAYAVDEQGERAKVLRLLGDALAQAQQWEQAERVTRLIPMRTARIEAMRELGKTLIMAEQWESAIALWTESQVAADETASEIDFKQSDRQAPQTLIDRRRADDQWKEEALYALAESLQKAGEYERLLRMVQHMWLNANTRIYTINLLPLTLGLLPLNPAIGIAFCEAFAWVDAFLKGENAASQ